MELAEILEEVGISEEDAIKFVKKFFPEPTDFDYKIVGAAFSLRALPATHAMSSIVKTMRGTSKAKVCKNRKEFGIAQGIKKYTNSELGHIVREAIMMLKRVDAVEAEELAVTDETAWEDHPPEWLTYGDHDVPDKEICEKFGEVFVKCGEKHGTKEEPKRAKAGYGATPDEIYKKLNKSGIIKKAKAKGKELIKKFLEKNENFEEDTYGRSGYRGKSVSKDGILTMTFYVGATADNSKYLRDNRDTTSYKDHKRKAAVLTSKWDEEGKLIDWTVGVKSTDRYY
jgi:hypothetical protein